MLIDVHGHVTAPDELYVYKAGLVSHRGAHGRGGVRVSDDRIIEAIKAPNAHFGNRSHLEHLDAAGVDVQLISPRPYQMMHSEAPGKIVRWFVEETNDIIKRNVELTDGRFQGVAGLPQNVELGVDAWVAELRRCVQDLGFVGALLNPDPHEGTTAPPPLGDRFWYPLYEALCELDVPAMIHSAGCRPPARESYSLHFIQEETIAVMGLLGSSVFDDFPDLRIIVSHGGGAIPYQRGRFGPRAIRNGERFRDHLRKLYFDTCLYSQDSIELLLRAVGVDRCLFGTEKPGTGSVQDPDTGRWIDDIHLLIRDIDWLDDDERAQLFEGNARHVFGLQGS
ncbi:amidohydrolase [Nitriliruptoraceae bacterium ZYF776]|nr:amidohydrolase [Profundirhabdus halotolerans]